jgi:two-component system, response regulator FlrC
MIESETIVTDDSRMKEVLKVSENVAASRAIILIKGESGTGKELLARFIHNKSPRVSKRFVAINCAALPDGLLESELFGFEKGAFTGATSSKPGKFELASDGTLLLDEMSEMALPLQAKLLRVIQENEVERLGARQPLKVNVRIIATTNRDLAAMVKQGLFREDLFYRLNVIPIEIPPLRERPRDVELLAKHFTQVSSVFNNRGSKVLSDQAIKKLLSWKWPGNIRELENVVERAVLLGHSEIISADGIHIEDYSDSRNAETPFKAGMTVSEAEKLLILKTLEHTHNNRTQAAKLLGISIRTLRNKLHEYGRSFEV